MILGLILISSVIDNKLLFIANNTKNNSENEIAEMNDSNQLKSTQPTI